MDLIVKGAASSTMHFDCRPWTSREAWFGGMRCELSPIDSRRIKSA